jgi:hypothetical protein
MKNYKLVKALDSAGLVSHDFYTDLERVILKLMGFNEEEQDDNLFLVYDRFLKKLLEMDIYDFFIHLDELALQFYQILMEQKDLKKKT